MDNPVFAYTFALVTLLIIPLIVFSVMTFQKMKKLEGAAANNEMMLALINSMKQELSESGHRSRVELQQRLDSITGFLSRSQQENSQNMQNQFRQSAAII
ncbi:MAG TPA: hypothetical protein PLT13_15470, partial [Spirochaetota bacterium]|nr:hypothetical protein [Spirochaetota bacterium]